jgi:hypothetical protein
VNVEAPDTVTAPGPTVTAPVVVLKMPLPPEKSMIAVPAAIRDLVVGMVMFVPAGVMVKSPEAVLIPAPTSRLSAVPICVQTPSCTVNALKSAMMNPHSF